MKYFTPDHISRLGIGEIMERTLKHLDADNCPIHISFDVDGIDPLYAPGTGTKVKEGLTPVTTALQWLGNCLEELKSLMQVAVGTTGVGPLSCRHWYAILERLCLLS